MTNELTDGFAPTLTVLPVLLEDKHLTGEEGSNRDLNQRCQISAANDYEAIHCWLDEYQSVSTTYRTYQKEAERLLLWAVIQQKKAFSSLSKEDLDNYWQFLANPQPSKVWCTEVRGRGYKRGDPRWRPFNGPLSVSAINTAMSALESLFSYLVNARYLAFNPLSLMRKRKAIKHYQEERKLTLQARMLEEDEWQMMLNVLESWPEEKEKLRLIFLVHILFFLGLRINELVTHRWNAFRKVDNLWWFYVNGKGNKLGRIPVNDELLRSIITYRSYLSKSPFPAPNEQLPIISSLTTGEAITARQINKLLKKLANTTADCFISQPEKAKKIRNFSAHWLRHLSASMQDKAGIAFKHIRANHRHENDETTRLYVHAVDTERHDDMQKLRITIKKYLK